MMNSGGIMLILSFLIACMGSSKAQKNDYHYYNTLNYKGVHTSWNETTSKLEVNIITSNTEIACPAMIISNSGQMRGYFDHFTLFDDLNSIAINGDDFNLNGYTAREVWIPVFGKGNGISTLQSTAVLPFASDSIWVMISNSPEYNYGQSEFLLPEMYDEAALHNQYSEAIYYSILRLRADGRLEVQEEAKEIPMIEGFLRPEVAACRHANGKDWWVIISNIIDDQSHTFLVDETGFHYKGAFTQSEGNKYCYPMAGMVRFSPDGSKMVRTHHRIAYNAIQLPDVIEIWDFNRCTGTVEGEPIVGFMPLPLDYKYGASSDAEFSSNGKYLYYANGSYLIQFDMEKEYPFERGDTIHRWDGEYWRNSNPVFLTNFWRMPDGKLLVNFFGLVPYLHIIHEPDKKGADCNFEYKAMIMPTNPDNPPYEFPIYSLPRSPDYRMTALDIDCTSSTSEGSNLSQDIEIYPNPFSTELFVYPDNDTRSIEVYNIQGKLMYREYLHDPRFGIRLNTESWAKGMYIITTKGKDGRLMRSKKSVKH
jgi:hypothetical protein